MTYAFWQQALAGRPVQIHESDPQPGYYRVRRKNGPWEPVGIWFDAGELRASRGTSAIDPFDIWTYAAKNPVTYEAYMAAVDSKGWPEDIDAEVEQARVEVAAQKAVEPAQEPTIGHNSGRQEEEIRDEIAAIDQAFQAWLANIGGEVTTAEHDAKAETFRTRAHDLGKRAEDTRATLKKPILEAGKALDAAWKPVVDAAEAVKKRVGKVVLDYRVEQDRIRRAEAERQRQEAEKARREAEAAARLAEAAGQPAPPPPPVEEPRTVAKGFRTVTVYRVTDLRAALEAILKADPEHAEIVDVVRTIGTRLIKAGVPCPGVEAVEERRV